MDNKPTINVMLDLEWLSDEYFNPLVTELGMAYREPTTGNIVLEKTSFNLNEQINNGARMGINCTGKFWVNEPLFGATIKKSITNQNHMYECVESVFTKLVQLAKEYKICLWGNNTVVDNAKLVWLFEKYEIRGWEKVLPHNTHKCFSTLKSYTKGIPGINVRVLEENLVESIKNGKDAYYKEVALHDPAYDAYKQLLQLEHIIKGLASLKD